jgi:hypothetical protein
MYVRRHRAKDKVSKRSKGSPSNLTHRLQISETSATSERVMLSSTRITYILEERNQENIPLSRIDSTYYWLQVVGGVARSTEAFARVIEYTHSLKFERGTISERLRIGRSIALTFYYTMKIVGTVAVSREYSFRL